MDRDNTDLYALIYETTINPEGYDALIDAWNAIVSDQDKQGGCTVPIDTKRQIDNDFTKIRSHLNRAESILNHIGRNAANTAPHTRMTPPAMTVAEDGRVIQANKAAALHFAPDVTLAAIYDACDADLPERLRTALRTLRDYRARQFVTLLTLPAEPDRERSTLHLAVTVETDLADRRKVLSLRALSIPWTRYVADQMASIFQLTPAEISLTQSLIHGRSLNQIAQSKKRSVETLRVQLKSVFRKTYSKTQSELVRTVMMFSVVVSKSKPPCAALSGTETAQDITLPDGRTMAVQYFGDADGFPVLFLHGMMDAFGGVMRITPMLSGSGLRLICPTRAGFGRSSPITLSGRKAQQQITADVISLADQLSLKRLVILGHLSGAAYSYPLASALGDRAIGILNISGAVPIRSMRQIRAMSPRQRVVALTARFWPDFLPPLLRIGISQIDSDHCSRFLNALFARGTIDRDFIERHDLYTLLADQYRWSMQNGYDGFRSDASLVTIDWFRDVAPPQCQTMLLHGDHDPVVDMDSARTFSASLPKAHIAPFPDGGQLLLYQYPERIIAELKALTAQA